MFEWYFSEMGPSKRSWTAGDRKGSGVFQIWDANIVPTCLHCTVYACCPVYLKDEMKKVKF